jgi:hypothetical protein
MKNRSGNRTIVKQKISSDAEDPLINNKGLPH